MVSSTLRVQQQKDTAIREAALAARAAAPVASEAERLAEIQRLEAELAKHNQDIIDLNYQIEHFRVEPGDYDAMGKLETLKRSRATTGMYANSYTARRLAILKEEDAALRNQQLQSLATAAEAFRTDPLTGGKGYSDPRSSVGYNPVTGAVEMGAGDSRGKVVSMS